MFTMIRNDLARSIPDSEKKQRNQKKLKEIERNQKKSKEIW